MIWESAIRAGDFAGIVPASRGAHCRPLHPRLASLCFREKIMEPRLYHRPGLGQSGVDCERSRRTVAGPCPEPTGWWGGSSPIYRYMFQSVNVITFWRTFRGGVAVI
jgi:hypothetical protein